MKTKALTKLAYEAPEASVDVIEMEQCILSNLPDFDKNVLYEDEFDE